jgi:AraC-like DNA-binding protein
MKGPSSAGFVFGECVRFVFARPWRAEAHIHGRSHELCLVVSGAVRTCIAGRVLEGRPGDALYYPAGVPHAPESVGAPPLEMANLRWSGGGRIEPDGLPVLRRDREGRIRNVFDWILDLQPGRTAADRRALAWLAQAALHEFARLSAPERDDVASRAIRFMRANLPRPLTVDDLAREVGLSRYHFTRRMRQLTGHPPMRLLCRLRVEAAGRLIAQTDMKLEAVAQQVGLADASHLSHIFRRIAGRPPGSLRVRS